LDFVFQEVNKLKKKFLFTIFTSNTFKSFHNCLNVTSPIYSKEKVLDAAKILNPKIEILNYKLEFNSPKDMFRYIKYSGVNVNVRANIKNIRKFFKTFPINFLEFEIVVLKNI